MLLMPIQPQPRETGTPKSATTRRFTGYRGEVLPRARPEHHARALGLHRQHWGERSKMRTPCPISS
jgi:hypothetical protein